MSKFVPVVLAAILAGGALAPVVLAHAADPAAKKTGSSVGSTGKVSSSSSELQKVAYSFGFLMGKGNADAIKDLDIDKFFAGFRDGYGNKPSALTEDEMRKTLVAYKEKHDAEAMQEIQKLAATNAATGAAFLADNGKKPGIVTTASGLQYEVLTAGTGAAPTADDQVQVHYEGKMLDGTVFDSSIARGQPVTFPLAGVIPGWTEGLQLMKEGGKTRFFIPSKLAYGETGAQTIPPNSVLVFEVQLLKVIKAGADKPADAAKK